MAVFAARNREFLRDRSTLAWNILFPVLVVVGFALVFSGQRVELYKVGVYGAPGQDLAAFLDTEYVQFVAVDELQPAIDKVDRHQFDLLLDTGRQRYWVNSTSPKGYILERVLWSGNRKNTLEKVSLSGAEVRYVDWLLPGILGLNMMFSALFGVGYVIVRYRRGGMLRRLKATPLKPLEFLLAQVLSRLWLIVVITVAIYFGTDLFINFRMLGSYPTLLLVLVLGAMSLISLGLLASARTASQELAGGLLNMLTWPMMFLSQVWFSLEGAPVWIQQLAQIFPLSHVIAGARAVMVDGAGLLEIGDHLGVLALMTIAFLLLGAWLFRWE